MSVVAIKNIVSNAMSGDESSSLLKPPSENYTSYGAIQDRGSRLGQDETLLGDSNSIVSELRSKRSNMEPENTSLFGNFDPRVMSDAIIGLSDGLTVPFALTAGLSSLGDTKLVITGGLAELVSGAISMGLGGYLAAKSESQYYHNEVSKEKQNFFKSPEELEYEMLDILEDIGITSDTVADSFIADLQKKPKKMVDFIIRYGKGLEEPADNRQLTSALTIGSAYFLGGFIPLLPYFFVDTVQQGLIISVVVMAITLFLFGYFKVMVSMGGDCGRWLKVSEGFQMLFVGGFAAASAWGLVRLIEN